MSTRSETPSPTVRTRPNSWAEDQPKDVDGEKAEKFDDKTQESVVADPAPTLADPPPDGGLRAWLVVLGCCCMGFSTFGFGNSFGVFQAYYAQTIPGATQFSIAWIGSLQYALIFGPGLLAGHLSDKGYYHPMVAIAAVVFVASTFLVAECTQIWQLVLCQGIAIGGSSGFMFLPSLSIIPQWFDKRRSAAYGLTAVGSSFGGTIFPIALRKLMAAVGFKWTIRILGFILGALLLIALLTVRPRVKVKKTAAKFPLKEILSNRANSMYVAGITIMWFGLYVPLGFFDVYAQSIGIDKTISYYPIVTANAASFFGRVSGGVMADKLGAINVMIWFSLVAAATTIAWPWTPSFATLEVVAAFYGFSSGVFVSLLPSPPSRLVKPHQVGATIGFSGSIMCVGALVGIPAAGQIIEDTHGFRPVGGYAGGMVVFACCFLALSRRLALGSWWGKF